MTGQGSGSTTHYNITIARGDIFVYRDIAHFNRGITLESGESPGRGESAILNSVYLSHLIQNFGFRSYVERDT
ncbi:MAG: hypothetical protein [Olavius algarvensis Delta 4 endosymbiont]|nr:MAG: hypothetical protein [Olavius algarvensis Delta 4 endosymbiont]